MDKHIKEWIEAEESAMRAQRLERVRLWRAEKKAKLPARLRPATSSDVVLGALFWYPETKYRPFMFWKVVSLVHYPDDAWKAYTAHDGCRYGLRGAFVEIE